MKKTTIFIFLFASLLLSACTYDNYDEPTATISGSVIYDGEPVYVKNNQVTFRLYEPGWELSSSTYMNVQIAQDGSFSSKVFAGKNYRLIRQNNIGPWVNPTENDTIFINNCSKNQKIDMAVTPYYLLRNATITCANKIVKGSCKVTEIVSGMQIEFVGLYAGRNIIVDDTYNFGSGAGHITTSANAGDQVELSLDLTGLSVNSTSNSLPSSGFIYGRMGLKIQGIDAMIFTEPFRLEI